MDHELKDGKIGFERLRDSIEGNLAGVITIDTDCSKVFTSLYVRKDETFALGMYFKRLGALLTETRWVD